MPLTSELLETLTSATRTACHSSNQDEDFEQELTVFLINALESNCTVYDAMSLIERLRM